MDDFAKAKGQFRIDKYTIIDGQEEFVETVFVDNQWFTAGWTLMLNIATGNTDDDFSNASAYLGVGNGSTAFSDAHTNLQGASTSWKAMESGYPTAAVSGQVAFKSKYTTSDANFTWEEVAVRSGNSVLLNRALTGGSAGYVKTNSEVWYLTLTTGVS